MIRAYIVAGALAGVLVGTAGAGPLNPPAGPIASTLKPLWEVEPRIAINGVNTPGDATAVFVITQPGSYYLPANVTGESGKAGIRIAASNVTVDLNGMTLAGVPGSLSGVECVAGTGPIVRNGTVSGWGGNGINSVSSGVRTVIENVVAASNGASGIAAGVSCTVRACTAVQNSGVGFALVQNGALNDCVARGNGGGGFDVGAACVFTNCTARDNLAVGFSTGFGAALINCTANNSTGIGISCGSSSSITNCSALQGDVEGIIAGSGSTVTGCAAINNLGHGFVLNAACTATGCSALDNGTDGFLCSGGRVLVVDCTSSSNDNDGVQITSDSVVRGCLLTLNGAGVDGAGVHATSSDNRIEGNSCTDNFRGVDVDTSGNIIVRNTCSGNTTNWDVVTGNVCLVVVATNAGAILGNSGGTAPGSTDPSVNFTY